MQKDEKLKVECYKCDGKGYTLDRSNQTKTMAPVSPLKIFCEKCNGTGYLPVLRSK